MFKTGRIYIKLWRNHVEISNLETGETITKPALNSFSSVRNVVGNFNYANEAIKSVLNELRLKPTFLGAGLNIIIQQLEGIEGGLSDIEKRALRDLGEMAGGRKVFIIEHSQRLSMDEALQELENK